MVAQKPAPEAEASKPSQRALAALPASGGFLFLCTVLRTTHLNGALLSLT